MQNELQGFATGTKAMIQSKWALNDVATALFIQGKALQNAERYSEAKAVYQILVSRFKYGQCWDPKGWFWKPADEAKKWLEVLGIADATRK